MPVGVSWATLVDHKIVYTNRRFTEIFGYVVGELENISDWIEKYPILSE
jgi:PAS domain-containing protein